MRGCRRNKIHPRGNPAIMSDLSPPYFLKIHTHTRRNPADSAEFPPFPSPCTPAPRSRQITTPASQHSYFLLAGCPSCRPTNSIKALKAGALKALHNITTSYTPIAILTV